MQHKIIPVDFQFYPSNFTSMTIIEAKDKLKTLRRKARVIREEIFQLRTYLHSQGVDPDREVDLTKRNTSIYKEYRDGETYSMLAKKYKLSPTTISGICKRIEITIQKKKEGYQKYIE